MEIQELNTTENMTSNLSRREVKMDTKFDFDDILLQPSPITNINSRYADIQLNKFLPVMAAPMDTVVSLDNYKLFLEHGIEVCMPRGEDMSKVDDERVFLSYSLAEFESMLDEFESIGKPLPKRICIDMANGHMERLHETIRRARELVGDSIEIMTGNVGSPEGFIELAQAGVDYVRCGIGFGGGCFVDGTLVKTSDGHLPIEDVSVGDMVLTNDGSYQEVISRTRYFSDENLITINGQTCTEDHEFFVVDKERQDEVNDENILELGRWLSAKELDSEKHMIVEIL